MMAYQPRVQNIMCTVDLGTRLNLHHITTHCYNVEYQPAKFNPVVMRLRKPFKFTTLIFTSGKIVLTGVKSEEDAKKAARIVARKIQKLGFRVKFRNFLITNIVASANLGFNPRFTNFYNKNKKFVDYEPELFPGLVYRAGVTVIVFKSGKVILTNAKTRQQIYDVYNSFKKSIHTSTICQKCIGI